MKHILLILAIVGLSPSIYAAPTDGPAFASDALAPVPPPKYESAFSDYKPATEQKETADKLWIKANQTVAAQSEEEAQEASPMPMSSPVNASEKSKTAQVGAPHMGHDMKMKGQ